MPTYLLFCKKCDEKTTRMFVPISKRHRQSCNKCGTILELIITAPHFVVNGLNAKNSYGLKATVGEMIDEADKRLGRKPQGEYINDVVSTRKKRKKPQRLVGG